MNMITLIKSNISSDFAYSFRYLIHCHHGRDYDRIQVDIVLEMPNFQIDGQREEMFTGSGFGF